MMVNVKSFGGFRRYLGRESARQIPTGSTVISLIDAFSADLRSMLLDSVGSLREDVNILVNGVNIEVSGGLDTVLCDGDEISIFSAAVGG